MLKMQKPASSVEPDDVQSTNSPVHTTKSKVSITNLYYRKHRQVCQIPLGKKCKKKTDKAAEHTRSAIALLYYEAFYQSNIPLTGQGGIVAQICKTLGAHPSTVSNVVREARVVFNHGDQYDPSRKKFYRLAQHKIAPNTFLQNQVAQYKELHSLQTTACLLNAMRRLELGQHYNIESHYIGRKSVKTALENMNCKIVNVQKTSQASDTNLHWVQARLNFTSQLLLRFGLELPENIPNNVKASNFLDKLRIHSENLSMSLFQIAWWDEIHVKQKIGEVVEKLYRFAKNEDGLYDEKGVIDDAKLVSLKLNTLLYLTFCTNNISFYAGDYGTQICRQRTQ